MSTALVSWSDYQKLPLAQRKRQLTPDEYTALTRQQRIAAGIEDDEESAPADFNGPVFPNPDHLRPQLDTDPAMPVTRVPEGVAFHKGNYAGGAKLDVSNPATADVLPEMGREIQATMSGPGTQALSPDQFMAQQTAAPPSALTPDAFMTQQAAAPEKPEPGFWDKLEAKLPGTADTGLKGAVHHIQDTRNFLKSTYDVSAPGIAHEIYKKLSGQPNNLKELPNEMLSQGLPLVLGGFEAGETAVTPKPAEVIAPKAEAAAESTVDGVIARAGEVAKRRLANMIPGVKAVKDAAYILGGGETPKALTPEVPSVWGKGRYGTPVDQWGQRIQPEPVFPGASQPTATLEQLNPSLVSPSRSLPGQIGPEVIRPKVTPAAPIPPRTGLALPPGPAEAAAAPAVRSLSDLSGATAAKITPKIVEQQLEEALGGKPLQRGVSLRNQRPLSDLNQQIKESLPPSNQPVRAPLTNLSQQIKSSAVPLPEGFTAVDSSAIKGFKYDADAQELTTVTNNGQRYTHGEVTPDEMKAFKEADSKGKAWNTIRQNHVLVKQNDLPVKPIARSADPDAVAPQPKTLADLSGSAASPAPGDLLSLLKQSVKKAQTEGVQTTATPASLAKRWGVDENSLAIGREQTRSMSPVETEADLQALTEKYKKGEPVEPIIETRDAQNNIISVDGRARALAARRAGVKRVPIIVRRADPTSVQ